MHRCGRIARAGVALAALLALGGCAILREFSPSVRVESVTPGEYIALKRGDVLTSGRLSAATLETLSVAGIDDDACAAPAPACLDALAAATGIADERRLSALAELWLQRAMAAGDGADGRDGADDRRLAAWLEVARHAYAYLFYSGRTPGERAFEDRQTQVRDYYNLAAQEAATLLFGEYVRGGTALAGGEPRRDGWRIRVDLHDLAAPWRGRVPKELVPASSLSFAGLRSVYRRDGFGAELVAVMADDPVTAAAPGAAEAPASAAGDRLRAPVSRRAETPAWSGMPSPAITVLLRFRGADLAQVLSTREVDLAVYDPYRTAAIELEGEPVPLAANFTAGYGLWLARSGFNRQSLRSLFGRAHGIDRPHLYLMQPYDPQRRIVLMIHGLASSPEAWVNVANELMGDEALRQHFQIWQFYYPTNMPIALNHYAIRRTLQDALRHFDPQGAAPASREMVLIGHSMGGVISRLLVSSSGDALWRRLAEGRELDEARLRRARRSLGPMLEFEPLPNVERAIFIASPHRGTDVAGTRLGRWLGRLVRLPLTVLEGIGDVLQDIAAPGDGRRERLPNSIDNLDRADPFVRAAAGLPISPRVRYHSIVARADPGVPLERSDDGLVPYWSAHLAGAASEKVITSTHSVQETAPAIIEMRRILHEDIRAEEAGDGAPAGGAPRRDARTAPAPRTRSSRGPRRMRRAPGRTVAPIPRGGPCRG